MLNNCSSGLTFSTESNESNGLKYCDKPGGFCQKSRECRSGEEQSHKSPTPSGGPDSIVGRSVYSHLSLGPHLAYDVSDNLES